VAITEPTSGLCSTNYGNSVVAKSLSDKSKSFVWSCWGTGGGNFAPCWTLAPVNTCSATNCGNCATVSNCTAAGCKWDYSGNYCVKKTTSSAPVNTCSATNCGNCNYAQCSQLAECRWSGGACIPQVTTSSSGDRPTYCYGSCLTRDVCLSRQGQVLPLGSGYTRYSNCDDSEICCVNISSGPSRPACAANGGTCVASGPTMTGGVDCRISGTQWGKTNMAYACSLGNVCCMPSTAKTDGKCVTYSTTTSYARIDNTCISGRVKWIDSNGYDGVFNWYCEGLNGGTTQYGCSAKSSNTGCPASGLVAGSYLSLGSYACGIKSGETDVRYKCKESGKAPVRVGRCPDMCRNGVCVGGSTGGTTVTPEPGQTSLILSATKVELYPGEKQLITAEVLPSGQVTGWISSDSAIATVDNGMITAIAPGEAVVTVTDSNKNTATVEVTVKTDELDCTNPAGKHNDRLCFVDTKEIKTCVNGVWSNPVACEYGCKEGSNICNSAPTKSEVSFKITFDGVRPNAECISVLDQVDVEVANVPTNKYQGNLKSNFSLTEGEVDSRNNQVFQVNNLVLNAETFDGVNNFNYIRVKGPFHLKRRMCQDNQNGKVPEHVACDISLEKSDKVYNFKNYTLLAGDTNRDGVINTVDRSFVKSKFNPSAEVSCGREGDLNLDGVVNSIDMDLVKHSLSEIDDE